MYFLIQTQSKYTTTKNKTLVGKFDFPTILINLD